MLQIHEIWIWVIQYGFSWGKLHLYELLSKHRGTKVACIFSLNCFDLLLLRNATFSEVGECQGNLLESTMSKCIISEIFKYENHRKIYFRKGCKLLVKNLLVKRDDLSFGSQNPCKFNTVMHEYNDRNPRVEREVRTR